MFEIGDKVYDYAFDEFGEVLEMHLGVYPVIVTFKLDKAVINQGYTADGRRDELDKNPVLFKEKVKIVPVEEGE